MKLKSALVIALLAIPTLASATVAKRSSTVQLGGAVATQQAMATIDISGLMDSVVYTVNCTLHSNGVSNQAVDFVKFAMTSPMSQAVFSLNNQYVGTTGQAKFATKTDVTLVVENVNKNAVFGETNALTIQNLDDTDTITISNCYAIPSV